MKTLLRYSLGVIGREYPYVVPREIQKVSETLLCKMTKYLLYKDDDIVLVPVDSIDYEEIMEYKEKYTPYTSNLIMYQNKFSKKEMISADFYLLQCGSLIENFYNVEGTFRTCCEKSNLYNEQIGCYKIKESGMKNSVIKFTYDYRFIISKKVKGEFELQGITNGVYIPVYGKRTGQIIAYQLECKRVMSPLSNLNHWSINRECQHCHKKYWEPIHQVPHAFYIPLAYKESLEDINATTEMFTNVGSRYYVISKRIYNILKDLGAKKLLCEPIVFVE